MSRLVVLQFCLPLDWPLLDNHYNNNDKNNKNRTWQVLWCWFEEVKLFSVLYFCCLCLELLTFLSLSINRSFQFYTSMFYAWCSIDSIFFRFCMKCALLNDNERTVCTTTSMTTTTTTGRRMYRRNQWSNRLVLCALRSLAGLRLTTTWPTTCYDKLPGDDYILAVPWRVQKFAQLSPRLRLIFKTKVQECSCLSAIDKGPTRGRPRPSQSHDTIDPQEYQTFSDLSQLFA